MPLGHLPIYRNPFSTSCILHALPEVRRLVEALKGKLLDRTLVLISLCANNFCLKSCNAFSLGSAIVYAVLLLSCGQQTRCFAFRRKKHHKLVAMNDKKVLKLAKGFYGRANSCVTIARGRVEKALQYQYRSRRQKKRDFRSLWIQQINAAVRNYGLIYSTFMRDMVRQNISLNRKMLSELATYEPFTFRALTKLAQPWGGWIPQRRVTRKANPKNK